jgi:creatinine amidohydrolase
VTPMELKDQFDPELRKSIKKQKKVAIIPVGSIEQHGPHLPVSTDSDIVTQISRQISRKYGFLLLSTINYGVSFEHTPFFNISIQDKTLQNILSEICLSLLSNNIKTIFVINGHHGNQKAIKNLSTNLHRVSKQKLDVFVFSYWHFMNREFDHAGFVETSLMLAISKKVKMKLAEKGLITKNLSEEKLKKLRKLASKSFPNATKNGIWGDPTHANVRDGKKILSEIVTNLGKKCQTCLTDVNRKLHQ